MTNVPTTAVRRERIVRVQPRRRGATTSTTVEVAPRADLMPEAPSMAVSSEVPAINPPALTPNLTPTRPTAARDFQWSADERRQYESLADAIMSRAAGDQCRVVTIFSATADTDGVQIVSRLASVIRERRTLRVLVANEVFPFRDAAVISALHPSDSAEDRQALQSRLELLRDRCDLLLCAGGLAAESLASVLGASSDVGYLAVKLGRTERDVARRALANLHLRGIRMVGCIVVQ